MNSIGMLAILYAHSAKNGIRMPSATAAAKNRNMPTRAAPGARLNVVMAEAKLLKNRTTSLLPTLGRPARDCGRQSHGALGDVNAYGAQIARRNGFSAKRSNQASDKFRATAAPHAPCKETARCPKARSARPAPDRSARRSSARRCQSRYLLQFLQNGCRRQRSW